MKGPLWVWYLAGTLSLAGLGTLMPSNGPASAVLQLAVSLSVVLALALGIRRCRPDARAPWMVLLAGYGFLFGANVAVWATGGPATALSADAVSGWLYLAAYVAIAAGIVLLARARKARRDLASLGDAAIVIVGIAIVWYELLLGSLLAGEGISAAAYSAAITYPLPDLLFLVGLLWIAFSPGPRSTALALLVGGIATQAVADALLGVADLGLGSTRGLEDVLWLVSSALVGAAAPHPSMPLVGAPGDLPSWLPAGRRIYLLAAVSTLIPVAVLRHALIHGTAGDAIFAVAMIALLALILTRFRGLIVDVDRYARTEAQLRASEERYRSVAAELDRRVAARTEDLVVANARLRAREAELVASHAFVDDIVATSPGIIFRGRLPGAGLDYISPSAERLLGWSVAEALATPGAWVDMVHPDDLADLWAASAAVLESGGEIFTHQARMRHRDGSYRWLLATMRYVRDETGQPSGFTGSAVDVSDRKAAETALEVAHQDLVVRQRELLETHTHLADLLASSPAVLFHGHGLQTIDYVSPSVEELLGFTVQEVLDTPDFWVGRLPVAERARLAEIVWTGPVTEARDVAFEHSIITRDGRERWMSTIIHVQPGDDGEPFIMGTGFDITDRRDAERDLLQAKEEAERANRAKSEFLSRASHELRTPLNSVLGFAQLLERSPLTPDDEDSVAHILRAGRTLLGMVDSLLELARVDSGRLTLSIEPVNVDELVEETIDLVRPMAVKRGISLIVPSGTEPSGWVLADRRRVRQVILNVLRNAVLYNRDGGSVTVSSQVVAPGDRLRISVADTGPGIPPERRASLFTSFDRSDEAGQAPGGLGVGLALSARLVEAMDGSIGVESEVGIGSTFTVELPLASEPVAGPGIESGPGAERGPRATIAYVEDNLANLRLVERILAARPGTRVLAAMQGSLGLDLVRQHHPDLVLLDLHLPDMSGEEVLRSLRDDPATRDVPVIVLSSAAGHGNGKRLLDLGAREYLAKPIDVTAFLEVVDRVLGEGIAHA